MPKYYVRDGVERAIVDADTELEACVKSVLFFFNSFVVNGFFIISEVGFGEHEDDKVYSSSMVLDYISEKQKKRKKDGDSS
tara:strand:+ start:4335 stop:4577 length:243 start_codon:yes stop_codon:yes gene_type:complete